MRWRAALVVVDGAFLEGLLAVALEHQVGGAPDIDIGYHGGKLQACDLERLNTNNCMACEPTCQGGGTWRTNIDCRRCRSANAAEGVYVDDRGGVGIRLEPAAAIVRQYGEQFRRAPRRQRRPRAKPPPLL
jgi:hypothetical protein